MIERQGNELQLRGPLTLANVSGVCEAGKKELSGGHLIVDFAQVTDVDSSALSLLFEWLREARRRNAKISFQHLPASLMSLASLYGVSDLLAITSK